MAFSYKDYQESDAVKKARQNLDANSQYNASEDVVRARDALARHEANKVEPWNGGTYGQALQDQINKINNRKEFTYDLNADALYQQYKDQYITGGKYAMMDTLGQASALTGGYGNSYANTAGNQAYQAYLQKLNDVVPDLYRMALDKYNQEGDDLKDMYNIYANQYGTEYGEYRDRVGDWNTEANRLSDQYYNEANMDYSRFADNRDYLNNYYNNERDYDYGQYSDAYNRAFANYQQQVAEQQYWNDYNLQQQRLWASMSSGSGSGSSSGSGSGYTEQEMQTASQSTRTRDFKAYAMTPTEFAKHGKRVNGIPYDNYNQYIDATLSQWFKDKKLTENETAYLKGYYGIG